MNCKCENPECSLLGDDGTCTVDDVRCRHRIVNGRKPIIDPDMAADFAETTRRINRPYDRTRDDDRMKERWQ